MDRYENMADIERQLIALASRLRLAKGDFEASEFDHAEAAEDSVDSAVKSIRRLRGK